MSARTGGLVALMCAPCLFVACSAHAFLAEDIILSDVTGEIYQNDYEQVVLDVVIPYNEGDLLNGLSVKNTAAVFDPSEIEVLNLYIDGGMPGYHGLGDDELIYEANWDSVNQQYYFDDLDEDIPPNGLRIFLTVSTNSSITEGSQMQLQVPIFSDSAEDGVFNIQDGDAGIFTTLGNNGPTDEPITNPTAQTMSQLESDTVAPVANLTNVMHNFTYTIPNLNVEIMARDRVGSGIDSVYFGVSTDDTNYTWHQATLVEGSSYYYRFRWENIPNNTDYYIRARASDTQIVVNTYTQADPCVITVAY